MSVFLYGGGGGTPKKDKYRERKTQPDDNKSARSGITIIIVKGPLTAAAVDVLLWKSLTKYYTIPGMITKQLMAEQKMSRTWVLQRILCAVIILCPFAEPSQPQTPSVTFATTTTKTPKEKSGYLIRLLLPIHQHHYNIKDHYQIHSIWCCFWPSSVSSACVVCSSQIPQMLSGRTAARGPRVNCLTAPGDEYRDRKSLLFSFAVMLKPKEKNCRWFTPGGNASIR